MNVIQHSKSSVHDHSHFTKISERSLVKQPCRIWLFQPIHLCMIDKAFNLVRKTQFDTVTFAGQGGMISVAMALEAAVGLVDWSEPVKGLEAASWGLQRLWWLSSSSQQTDHSAAAAPSCRVTACAGQALQAPNHSVAKTFSMWALSLSGSLSPFPLYFFGVDWNAAMCLYGRLRPFLLV